MRFGGSHLHRILLTVTVLALWACSGGTGGGAGTVGGAGGDGSVGGGPVGGGGLTGIGAVGSGGQAAPGMEEVALGSGTVDYAPTFLMLSCKPAPEYSGIGNQITSAEDSTPNLEIQQVPALLLSGKVESDQDMGNQVIRLVYRHLSQFRDVRLDDHAKFERIFLAEAVKPEIEAFAHRNFPAGSVNSDLQNCPDSACLASPMYQITILPQPSCFAYKIDLGGIQVDL